MFVTDNDSLTDNGGRPDDHHRRGGNDYWRWRGYDDYRRWCDADNFGPDADGAIFPDDVMGAMVITVPTAVPITREGISDVQREQ
jgi:hypothetical protein